VGRDLSPRDNHGPRNTEQCTVLFPACTSEGVSEAMFVKRNSARGPSYNHAYWRKHDAFDQDLPVSASLLLGNSVTLQETLLYQWIDGSWQPCALCHKWRSVLRNALAHSGPLTSAVLLRVVLQTTSLSVTSDFAAFIPVSRAIVKTPHAKYLGVHIHPNRRRPRCNT
jgi:hypothetical protein